MVHNSLVYQPISSTEAIIQRTIKGIQKLINPQHGNMTPEEEAAAAVIEINPVMKRHCESQIKILRDSPRDATKLKEILKSKQKEYEKAQDSEDIESLVSEIEMLKFVIFLVRKSEQEEEEEEKKQKAAASGEEIV